MLHFILAHEGPGWYIECGGITRTMPVTDPATIDALTRWNNIKVQIAALEQQEKLLRTELLTTCFDPEFLKGSRTIPLWQGWRLRGQRSWSYKLTDENGETRTVLSQFYPETARNLVTWKPNLSTKAFNDLAQDAQAAFAPALTIAPESPQLTLLAPNAPETPTLY